MVTVLGVQFPTSGAVLRAPKTEIVLAYTKAMREGKGEAKKFLKITEAKKERK
ncbi:MAG: hypothetical protein AAB552_03995 [Patescibacteria group bacterium]